LFTLGNKSTLSFHLLIHKLLAVLDNHALEGSVNLLTSEVAVEPLGTLSISELTTEGMESLLEYQNGYPLI
jgi:hypothetical protein